MKLFLIITGLLSCLQVFCQTKETTTNHGHHAHSRGAKLIDGEFKQVNSNRFEKFVVDLENHQVAIISVKGMVCDFCARGIQKTFKKNNDIDKIDVDLEKGKVLLAFKNKATINFEEISTKIQSNGQTAVSMEIIKI